ncbi:General transcription factor II-I repeat domain-containing protein 2 [Cucumispora dikerogammari]|nr:General transcription factor II-I repeat domain-containing protein 2 [Cucumispora dikerogammari]
MGLVKLMGNKIKCEHSEHTLVTLHCIIHQESLCKTALYIKHVIDPAVGVINIIKARALNHRQLKALLEDLESEHYDVLYHNSVRWLSLGKILRRVWYIREETVMLLESKHIVCEFVINIFNEAWKSDFIFLNDIIEMLSELNKKLRGNGLFAHEMYVFVKSFKAKLSVFSRQASDNTFPHFPMLKQSNISRDLAAKYKLQIDT